MNNYVAREDVIRKVFEQRKPTNSPAQNRMLDSLQKEVLDLPTETVEKTVHGQWRVGFQTEATVTFSCSECGRSIIIVSQGEKNGLQIAKRDYPFCHCGAKMDKGR